ncbi:protein of unknown function [Paraoerskovia marina]|uniref:Protein-glutamine gamma-glutamyltransferase-like C-terminal domain-containing protein n=1 Tax=Paraoerskovia marina TaxID=545619 RepID=A0A1H1SXA6_9CELL|nr:DUF4129 domain-containing protein [Paraoerskovia marina]SDS52518.1 protein of unknown function [Paraoerskovia marina]
MSEAHRGGHRVRIVAAAVVACLVVLVAATATPWVVDVTIGDQDPVDPVALDPTILEYKPPARGESTAWNLGDLPRWTALLPVLALVGALVALFGRDVLRWLRDVVDSRRRRTPTSTSGMPSTGGTVDASSVTDSVRHAVGDAHAALDDRTRDPSDAVVAAWVSLEAATADLGLERDPTHTPGEYVLTVLTRTGADPDAARELLALYHRARFAHHHLSPDDLRAAHRSLDRLTETLTDPAGLDTEPGRP